jgi:O-antigen ligase
VVSRTNLAMLAASVVGLVLLASGVAIGGFVLALVIAAAAFRGGSYFVIASAVLLPVATIGWTLTVLEVQGRTFDVRLLLTFLVAGLGLVLVLRTVRSLHVTEWLMLAFVAWLILDGVAVTRNPLIWAPPAARWAVYWSMFVLARRHLSTLGDIHILMTGIVVGFLPTALAGVAQFVLGAANVQNAAIRATGFIESSPIALAFAGQMAVLIVLPLAAAWSGPRRLLPLIAAGIGWVAIVASATRIVLVTAYFGVTAFAALRQRWRIVALVTAIFAASLIVRPDFVGRFLVLAPPPGPSLVASPSAPAEPSPTAITGDTSLRYRFFVWGILIKGWEESPLIGIGPGMAAPTIEKASPTSIRQAPHNDYVGALTETGVIGLALFVALQAAVLIQLSRCALTAEGGLAKEAILVSAIAFVTVNVLGVLNNPQYAVEMQAGLWAVIGSALAIRFPKVTDA